MDTNYLMHHGIKGQRWGVRRYQNADGSLTEEGKRHYNSNYSESQRSSDIKMYGQKGMERINRSMNDGAGIKAARSEEAYRRAVASKNAKYTGRATGSIGKTALGLGVGIGTYLALRRSGVAVVNGIDLSAGVAGIASGAGGQVGEIIGRNLGVSVSMLASGYTKEQYRP